MSFGSCTIFGRAASARKGSSARRISPGSSHQIARETPAAGETNLKYRAERKAFQGADATSLHAQSFISQVRIGHKSAIDEMVGHTATAACHLGNIAAKTGRTLHWNAAREDFENDPEASKLLTRSLRKPYDLIQL